MDNAERCTAALWGRREAELASNCANAVNDAVAVAVASNDGRTIATAAVGMRLLISHAAVCTLRFHRDKFT